MSQQITTAFVQQYKSNVLILAQQKPFKLAGTTRVESVTGKAHYFERIGATAAVLKTTRHADTPLIETPHSRRMVTMSDYEWADLVDQADKIRLLISPQSEYAINGAYAMNRTKDDLLIAAFGGNAYGGENGTDVIPLPAGQKGTQGAASLTMTKLLEAKRIMDVNEIDPDGRYIMVSPKMIESMLNTDTKVTSADYNTVKSLVRGEINSWLGFTWIMSNRLPIVATFRCAYAWQRNAMGLAIGADMTTRITERADKSYSTQVYLAQTYGATRIEDEGVVEIPCLATD